MAWWVMPQLTMSLIGEYTHKEHVALQHYCSPLFLKSILQFPEQTLQWKNNLSSFSRTTRSLHMFHFLISDGAASVSIHCVDCNVWEKKMQKTHKDQPIIWYVLNIRNLSVDFEGLCLLFSQCNWKNSVKCDSHWALLVNCGTMRSWGKQGKRSGKKLIHVMVGLILLFVSLFLIVF